MPSDRQAVNRYAIISISGSRSGRKPDISAVEALMDASPDDRSGRHSLSRGSERVIAYVRVAMRDGRLAPGERVIEREIARELQVGRAAVREAIQVLIAQGYLVRTHQRSSRVKAWSRTEMLDFLDVWGVVGPSLLRLVTERIRIRDNAARVRHEFESVRASWLSRHTNRHAHVKAFGSYIATLLDIVGNPVLKRACDSLNLELYAGSLQISNRHSQEYLQYMAAVEHAVLEAQPDIVEAEYRKFVVSLGQWLREDYDGAPSAERD